MQARIGAVAIAVAWLGLSPSGFADACDKTTACNCLLQGAFPMEAVGSMSVQAAGSCTDIDLGGDPPTYCTGSCSASVDGVLSGHILLRYCYRYLGGCDCWGWGAQAPALTWGRWDGSGYSGMYTFSGTTQPPGFSVSVSAVVGFARPVQSVLNSAASAVTGGRVVAGTRYLHAGESLALEFDGLGWYFWRECLDADSNGICDDYDAAARNFGDFDASGDVGASDLATLLDAWGGTDSGADLDDDGVVGASDLGILLSRWGLGA